VHRARRGRSTLTVDPPEFPAKNKPFGLVVRGGARGGARGGVRGGARGGVRGGVRFRIFPQIPNPSREAGGEARHEWRWHKNNSAIRRWFEIRSAVQPLHCTDTNMSILFRHRRSAHGVANPFFCPGLQLRLVLFGE
jgi:hypothetical protein